MSQIAAYADRAVDVLAFAGQRSSGDTLLTQTLDAGMSGLVCAGAQAVAQRWLIAFLQRRGTVAHAPNEGSDFMTDLAAGTMRTETDMTQAFASAAADVAALLTADQLPTDPADELLDHVELLSVSIEPGLLVLQVFIVTQAGTNRAFLLPLSTVPGGAAP